MTILHSLGDISLAWLTEHLQPWLGSGMIKHMQMIEAHTPNSQLGHIQLQLFRTPIKAPRQLLLKINHEQHGAHEVAIYQHAQANDLNHLPFVPCFGASYDPVSGVSNLLLADLSETYEPAIDRQLLITGDHVPNEQRRFMCIDGLAQLHSSWWQAPVIGTAHSPFAVHCWYNDSAAHAQHVQRRQAEWQQFLAQHGAILTDAIHDRLASTLAALPTLWQRWIEPRVNSRRQLTLVHGACAFNQFFCPKNPQEDYAYLLDFGAASANLPTYDLVRLLATFWNPTQRAFYEEQLLRRYLAGLIGAGIDYSWQQLCSDYRLMLAYMLFEPIENAINGLNEASWWSKLQCLAAANDEWQSEQLWQ